MGPGRALSEPSSGSSHEAFKFPKLTGENYATWCQHMQAALQSRYLWLIVTGDESQPDKPDAESPKEAAALATWKSDKKEWLDWSLRDQAAQGLMKGAAEPSQWPHVAKATTSQTMWDTWKKLYVTNQQTLNVHYYFEELYTTKYVEGVVDGRSYCVDVGSRSADHGRRRDHFGRAYCARARPFPTPKPNLGAGEDTGSSARRSLPRILSQRSYKRNLTAQITRKRPKQLFLQGKRGKAKNGGGAAETKRRKKAPAAGPKAGDECRYCHGKGHWANKCQKREEDEKRTGSSSGAGGSANLTVGNLRDFGTREVGQLFLRRRRAIG